MMHIICFSNPQYHMATVESALKELIIDHTDTVVVPSFKVPINEPMTITNPVKQQGQTMQTIPPIVLMFVYFKGDVPKIIEEIWAKQKEKTLQKK